MQNRVMSLGLEDRLRTKIAVRASVYQWHTRVILHIHPRKIPGCESTPVLHYLLAVSGKLRPLRRFEPLIYSKNWNILVKVYLGKSLFILPMQNQGKPAAYPGFVIVSLSNTLAPSNQVYRDKSQLGRLSFYSSFQILWKHHN